MLRSKKISLKLWFKSLIRHFLAFCRRVARHIEVIFYTYLHILVLSKVFKGWVTKKLSSHEESKQWSLGGPTSAAGNSCSISTRRKCIRSPHFLLQACHQAYSRSGSAILHAKWETTNRDFNKLTSKLGRFLEEMFVINDMLDLRRKAFPTKKRETSSFLHEGSAATWHGDYFSSEWFIEWR